MQDLNILISSAGRRVGLLECFRESLARRGLTGAIVTIDSGFTAPATFLSDSTAVVPPCVDPAFIPSVLELCRDRRIALIVPTIDPELPVYAAARQKLSRDGVIVCVSQPEVIGICANKAATHLWLQQNGFPTVRQTDVQTALSQPHRWPFPLIAKPVCGSASTGLRTLRSGLELRALLPEAAHYVIEEVARGREFTIHVYVNRSGACVCAVPHWRMEVRGGEVSKGVTVKEPRLMALASSVAEALPGAYGPLNIQCFMDDGGTISIFEINARFGGGYPLAHRAGARLSDWLLDELQGCPVPPCDDWHGDLAMLRYDEAVFVPGHRIRECETKSAQSSTLTTPCSLSATTSAAVLTP